MSNSTKTIGNISLDFKRIKMQTINQVNDFLTYAYNTDEITGNFATYEFIEKLVTESNGFHEDVKISLCFSNASKATEIIKTLEEMTSQENNTNLNQYLFRIGVVGKIGFTANDKHPPLVYFQKSSETDLKTCKQTTHLIHN